MSQKCDLIESTQLYTISRVLIESKITLGLGGVVIVILSVVASVGCFGFMDIESTLIIFQILPFLIPAIGVDNMFILVQTYQRSEREKSETAEEQKPMTALRARYFGSSFLRSYCGSSAFR